MKKNDSKTFIINLIENNSDIKFIYREDINNHKHMNMDLFIIIELMVLIIRGILKTL